AGLYALRVLAGNAATGLAPSFWLLAFSIFLFLSLAMAKRYAELLRLGCSGESAPPGRGYLPVDREMVGQLGVASGYASALVLALYFNSPQAALLYARPGFLWLLCVLLLYWISHLWLVAHRGRLDDDPVIFAMRDRVSRLVAVIGAALLILAR
ncbi:UbiA prenyltransferase, partial [mine drainage metagenome]